MPEYLEYLQMAIRRLYKCEPTRHLETIAVKEVFRGETIWEGDVEVFAIAGHNRATRCYAWSLHRGEPNERITAILEVPPVKSAADAVRVSILAQAKPQDT